MKFKKNIIEIILKNEIRKFAKWTKKSQSIKKVSRLSNERLNEIVATIFDKKIQMFKKNFSH